MSTDREMDKEWVKKTYTMEYCSAIKSNEIGLFLETWLDLKSTTQSEVSQKISQKVKQCFKGTYLAQLFRMNSGEGKRWEDGS